MNKAKLKRLQLHLEQQLDSPEAARFNMSTFGQKYNPGIMGTLQNFVPVCGTQACLAGEAVIALNLGEIYPEGGISLLSRPTARAYGGEIESAAIKELKLTLEESERLFYFKGWRTRKHRGWPKKFQTMYANAQTPQGRLYAAIRRLEHFIQTDGLQ